MVRCLDLTGPTDKCLDSGGLMSAIAFGYDLFYHDFTPVRDTDASSALIVGLPSRHYRSRSLHILLVWDSGCLA